MSIAEVAKATFYRHFESKDALVLAYLENRDRALWDYLSQPTPPKDLREALTKFEQMANRPEIIGCPFLRIASEYPDTAHPYHRRAIEHQNKILDYLTDLLKPFAIDKRAAAAAILSVIDGAFSVRMLYGNFEGGSDSLVRRGSTQELSDARELNAADDWRSLWKASSPHCDSTPAWLNADSAKFKAFQGPILYEVCSELSLGMLNYS